VSTTLRDRLPAYEAAARVGTPDDSGSARADFDRALLPLSLGHRWGVADALCEVGLATLDLTDRNGDRVLL